VTVGITPLSLETLRRHIDLVGGFSGCRMMELGSQQAYQFHHAEVPEGAPAKPAWERLGVRHVSVDLNGEFGAQRLDLSRPIEKAEWDGAFDVVTDFGTSEHVGRSLGALYHCRANCHRWCRPGGLMFFVNPKTGHWPDHGYHYFTVEHYEQLARACLYHIVQVYEHPTLGNMVDGWQVNAVLQKVYAAPFLAENDFVALCARTVLPY